MRSYAVLLLAIVVILSAVQVNCLLEGLGILGPQVAFSSGNQNQVNGITENKVGKDQKASIVSIVTKSKYPFPAQAPVAAGPPGRPVDVDSETTAKSGIHANLKAGLNAGVNQRIRDADDDDDDEQGGAISTLAGVTRLHPRAALQASTAVKV